MHRIEAYITLALIFIAIITILYLPIMFALKKRGRNIIRQFSYLGLFCSLFFIIFATILFTPITFRPETHTLNLVPVSWIGTSNNLNPFIVEKIPNVLLFIPLGFFIPVVLQSMRKWYKTIGISFAVTFCVEFIQYFIGRSSDIDDIITNLLGAIIGYLVYSLIDRILRNSKWWNGLLYPNTRIK